jgi:hypothetical protein
MVAVSVPVSLNIRHYVKSDQAKEYSGKLRLPGKRHEKRDTFVVNRQRLY